jgi:hypothetical protein
MDWLPAIAVVLGALGSVLAVLATFRGQQTQSGETRLSLAWSMQEKQMEMLVSENKELRERMAHCDKELVDVLKNLSECKDGRRQLEIQVELLKLQVGRSSLQ